MKLKSITPKNIGPFVSTATLYIDPEVTVITGPNDVGKSLALRAIEIFCTENHIARHEVNRDRIGEFSGNWEEDPNIICDGMYEGIIKDPKIKMHPRFRKLFVKEKIVNLTVSRQMSSLGTRTITSIIDGNDEINNPFPFRDNPNILMLPQKSNVREEIQIKSMTDAECNLLQLGFGPAFSFSQHASLSMIDRAFRIREAEDKLNSRLQEILPVSMPLRFCLVEPGGQPELLSIGLVDQHMGFTPLGSRGAGVKRILNVMGALLRLDPNSEHSIILYDEPETSLHADAQHMLRRLLENLGSNPNVQVVYTTHSPAMINTMRPHSIRVIERKRVEGKAVSCFINDAYSTNYFLVRSSLGISPADSLLYAPITVIAEGATEIRCLPLLLKKLADSGRIESVLLDRVLSQTHLLDGEGSSFEYMCRIAKSQNAKPVVFLDGDKLSDIQKVKQKHPEIPVITLNVGKEFEDIVSKGIYIQAVAQILKDSSGKISEESFEKWESEAKLREGMMFTKRIDRWLDDEFEKPLYKPLVMQKAIELSEIEQIETEAFEQLFEAMIKLSDSL
ncbi:ATP-dependent nuclease [Gimesia sp.]|uniref:ATP-dependent nuclease n=1 Tax=Gimesia sp. TaxID=2024833 RepID=UPI003A929E3D